MTLTFGSTLRTSGDTAAPAKKERAIVRAILGPKRTGSVRIRARSSPSTSVISISISCVTLLPNTCSHACMFVCVCVKHVCVCVFVCGGSHTYTHTRMSVEHTRARARAHTHTHTYTHLPHDSTENVESRRHSAHELSFVPYTKYI